MFNGRGFQGNAEGKICLLIVWFIPSRIMVGASHALVSTTVYLVETTSRDLRGTLSLWESVLRCSGCLLVYALGFVLRWHQVALYAPIVPILALLVGLCVPESPVYLMKRENTEGAARAVTRLFGPEYNVDEEVEIIKVSWIL